MSGGGMAAQWSAVSAVERRPAMSSQRTRRGRDAPTDREGKGCHYTRREVHVRLVPVLHSHRCRRLRPFLRLRWQPRRLRRLASHAVNFAPWFARRRRRCRPRRTLPSCLACTLPTTKRRLLLLPRRRDDGQARVGRGSRSMHSCRNARGRAAAAAAAPRAYATDPQRSALAQASETRGA